MILLLYSYMCILLVYKYDIVIILLYVYISMILLLYSYISSNRLSIFTISYPV